MTTDAEQSTTRLLRLVTAHGGAVATVSRRAASLRTLEVGGLALVEPTSSVAGLPGMAGAVLAPWPNRVDGGTWWYAGRKLQLRVTEPELGNAIHGLLTETEFEIGTVGPGFAELRAVIEPQPGYPFLLAVVVRYRLHADGISARVEIRNRSAQRAPVAVGAHPYLRLGDEPPEALLVTIDADRRWPLDARNLPGVPRDVRGTPDDPRAPHPLASSPTHALYQRSAPARGDLVHSLRAADGRSVELHAEATLPWTQWYVAPDLMTDEGPRRALAIEPMSAPPNALRTGLGLCHLEPGETRRWNWRIRLRQPASRTR